MPLACRAVEELVQTVYLKSRVMGHFCHVRVAEHSCNFFGDGFPTGAVDYLHGPLVKSIGKQKYLKVRGLYVLVQSRFSYIYTGISLQVYVEDPHIPITPPGAKGLPVIGSVICPMGSW